MKSIDLAWACMIGTRSRLGRALAAVASGRVKPRTGSARARSIDFIATALPGVRLPRRVAGAVIEASYPFGPRLGCSVNLTAFGNGDRLDIGISLDPGAITNPDSFLECLDEALGGFVLERTGGTRDDGGAGPPLGEPPAGS